MEKTQDKIQLPQEVAQNFDLVQEPPQDEMYFGLEVGRITFSKMTPAQAAKLVQMGSPYLKAKKAKEDKPEAIAKTK